MRQTSLETSKDTNGKIRTTISKEYCGKILVSNPRLLSDTFTRVLKEPRNAPPTFANIGTRLDFWLRLSLLAYMKNLFKAGTNRYFTDVYGLSISIFRNISKGKVRRGTKIQCTPEGLNQPKACRLGFRILWEL